MTFPDLPAILAAILLAPILLLAPGYSWSRLADVGPVNGAERAAWSLVLSLATVPVLAYNFFLLFPYNAWTISIFAVLAAGVPAFLHRAATVRERTPVSQTDLRPLPHGRGPVLIALRRWWILPALMALLALTCLMDVERGVLLYRGYPAGDYHKHIFVADAISRTGIHPVNPVFHPGRPLPLFYYFFWHLLCSMVQGLSGWRLNPRATVEGMTAWASAGLFAVVLLLACRFLRPVTRRTIGICWALVFATGLDLAGYILCALANVDS